MTDEGRTLTGDNNTIDPQMAVDLARKFHDNYERLAPQFGYETRLDTKQFDPLSPNGMLMTAVVAQVMYDVLSFLATAEKMLAEMPALEARHKVAEGVIGHYADLSHWKRRYSTSIAARVYCTGIDDDPTNGYDKAQVFLSGPKPSNPLPKS